MAVGAAEEVPDRVTAKVWKPRRRAGRWPRDQPIQRPLPPCLEQLEIAPRLPFQPARRSLLVQNDHQAFVSRVQPRSRREMAEERVHLRTRQVLFGEPVDGMLTELQTLAAQAHALAQEFPKVRGREPVPLCVGI